MNPIDLNVDVVPNKTVLYTVLNGPALYSILKSVIYFLSCAHHAWKRTFINSTIAIFP